MTDFPTGNLARDGVIVTLLQEAMDRRDPITFANIGLLSDQYGDRLDEKTREAFKATWVPLTEGEFKDAVAFMAAGIPAAEPEAEPVQAAPEISRDAAQENVRLAHDNLALARRDLMTAQAASKTARGVLSNCVIAWQNGGCVITREELVRETLAANQREREQNGPDRRYGRSATAFTQKQMVTGNRRGSIPLIELQRMRARAAQAKLPSER